jgi:hypothetical protein
MASATSSERASYAFGCKLYDGESRKGLPNYSLHPTAGAGAAQPSNHEGGPRRG